MNFANLTRRFFNATHQLSRILSFNTIQRTNFVGVRSISTTPFIYNESNINEDVNKKLMEFFDDKKNWNENDVKHGRSWQLPELRIKSNTDLHKLWYILLKERNMLMTMEHEHSREWRWWASPERLDKVKDSMKNVETVVRERNRAYYELETGEDGEVPVVKQTNMLGLVEVRRKREHRIPLALNRKWRENNPGPTNERDMHRFLKLYREKNYMVHRRSKNRARNHVIRLLRRFPDLDRNILKQKYPSVNIDNLGRRDKFRGHYVFKVD